MKEMCKALNKMHFIVFYCIRLCITAVSYFGSSIFFIFVCTCINNAKEMPFIAPLVVPSGQLVAEVLLYRYQNILKQKKISCKSSTPNNKQCIRQTYHPTATIYNVSHKSLIFELLH